MITGKDVHAELERFDTVCKTLLGNATSPEELKNVSIDVLQLKAMTIVIRLLHSIRKNQTLLMEKQGISVKAQFDERPKK